MKSENVRTSVARRSILVLAAAAGAVGAFAKTGFSAPLTWDNNGATAPNPQDGDGAWDTALLNWWNGASNVNWNNANLDTAVFGAGGASGTVTLGSTLTVGGLTLNQAGYTLTGGGIVVAGPTNISLTVAGMGTINSAISGNGPITFNVAAGGTLNSFVANAFTGNATVSGGGILNIGTLGTFGAGSVTLDNAGLRFSDARTIGTLVFIPTGSTGTLAMVGNGSLSGALGGTGTLVHDGIGTAKVLSLNGNNATFAGTVRASSLGNIRFTSTSAGSPLAVFDSGTNGLLNNRVSGTNTIQFGDLIGGGTLAGSSAIDGNITYQVGALGNNSTFSGNIVTGSSANRRAGIRKVGGGTWTITGAGNTYNLATIVDDGTLALGATANINTSTLLAVNSPGHLDVSANPAFSLASGQALVGTGGTIHGNVAVPAGATVNAGGVGTVSTLNFTNHLALSGGELRFDFGAGSDLLGVTGDLNLGSGSIYVNPVGGGLAVGSFALANIGSLNGSVNNVSLIFGQRTTGTLTSGSGQLGLNITSVGTTGNLNWNGTANGDWAVSGAQNFFNNTIAAQDAFFQNDTVTFGDVGAGVVTTINKIGQIIPAALNVTANTSTYTIGGTGDITGSFALQKSGAATLIMATANTFTGGVTINGGTLQINVSNAIGAGAINVNNGAFMMSGSTTVTNTININAAGVTLGGNGTLSGSATDFGVPWNLSIPTGSTVSIASTLFSTGLATGNVDLGSSNGALRWFGTGATSVINASQSTFNLGTGSATMLSRDGNGGTVILGGLAGGPNTQLRGASTTNAAVTYQIGANGSNTVMAGTIANGTQASLPAVNIIKNGGGVLTLSGNNSYTGTTAVNSGGLIVNGSHTGGGAYTIAGGTSFGGNATITAGVTLGAGVTVTPGASVGRLTVGSLAVNADTFNYEYDANGGDSIVVSNASGLAVTGTSNINISDLGGAIAGAYPLFDYSGTPLAATGFTLNQATLGAFTASLSFNSLNSSIDLILNGAGPVTALWNVDGDANWSPSGSWVGGVPNAIASRANFTGAITAPRTVTVDSPKTVSVINFENANSYTVAGGNAVTLDTTGGSAAINATLGSHTISAPLSLQKNTSLHVAGATSTLTLSALQPSTVAVTKSGPGVLAVNNVQANSLSVGAGKVVVLANGTAAGTSKVSALTLSTGTTLDLTNNALVVDYDATDPTADIVAAIVSGYAAGAWTGTGINSSTAAGTPGRAIGYARSSEVVPVAIFGTVDATAVLARYTLLGDANLDGTVSLADFTRLAAAFGTASNWSSGDFNYDNSTTLADFTSLAANFGNNLSSLPRASVPEPTMVLPVIAAIAAVQGRRRRKLDR